MIYIFGGAFDPPHAWHAAIIRSILHHKNPERIVVIPSWMRDDKSYNVENTHRKKMCEIFIEEINDPRVVLDFEFFSWTGEMITRDVDIYARGKYGGGIVHIFGTDTIASMPSWDVEQYAAKVVKKVFVPRFGEFIESGIDNYELFTDSHIPDISSTGVREIIPELTDLKAYFEEDPSFIIPGLSKKISRYILDNRLYRPKLATKPRILVHICCGPDATMPILQLRDEYEVICFWYDPNIQPKSEHDKRYEAFVKVCEIENIPYIKWAYDVGNFLRRIKWLEHTPEKWEKCTNCYDMRMYVAAKLAKKLWIQLYTSSLNTSPKKDLEKLFKMWHKYAEKYGITFLDIPFRKRWGFEKSVEYTREHDIFRQNYCGCIYSIREGGESDMKTRMVG
jgi:nicotinate (nicotinamide) nucleotide adenylyltransferase